MKQILLIALGLTTLMCADFTRSGNVVTDHITGLQWQDDTASGTIEIDNWLSAIDYCESLSLDGGGWRLPNINELRSLVDYTKMNPSINPVFQNVAYENYRFAYYSSTTLVDSNIFGQSYNMAATVDFSTGISGNQQKDPWIRSYTFVRCVR